MTGKRSGVPTPASELGLSDEVFGSGPSELSETTGAEPSPESSVAPEEAPLEPETPAEPEPETPAEPEPAPAPEESDEPQP